jgi:enolase
MDLHNETMASPKSANWFVRMGVATQWLFLSAMVVLALSVTATQAVAAQSVRPITLNCQHTGATFHSPLNVCIGGDHAANEIHSEVFRQMAIAHRQCGIAYIRFHGLF